eukprot:2471465-Pyramimonas_sp.AAC.1
MPGPVHESRQDLASPVRSHIPRTLLGSRGTRPCGSTGGWGVGLSTAEFHYALAGDQETHDRHEDILQRANELRDL